MHLQKIPFLLTAILVPKLFSQDVVELDEFKITGRGSTLVGEAISASEGIIGQVDLETRPMLRTGEMLEAIPGMIVTQHSGSGKANQYFLRGFNLDHGTDFATWIDGMPVNMVSHGHGQGYTDINFIIPELVDTITYLKGSYYASVGDFASAGSAQMTTSNSLQNDLLSLSIGEDSYLRALAAGSERIGNGELILGIEQVGNNGPWDLDENLDKLNGMIKYASDRQDGIAYSLTFMGYDSSWDSTDQIPQRAVEQGLISDYGFIDDTVGGSSSRYSLSGEWTKDSDGQFTKLTAYSIYYDMDLWSNFTYFLDNPEQGDQFQQSDQRVLYGANLSHTFEESSFLGNRAEHTIGLSTRFDDIEKVGLYNTFERQVIGVNREDSVKELSLSAFYDTEVDWTETFSTNFGLRFDYFDFDVDSDFAANSGSANDTQVSPKFNAVYTPSDNTELYLSAGYGFHSNDARGATITIDPSDRITPVDSVDLLVRSFGYEIGIRHNWNERSNTSIALWTLDLDSELLYVGDAGNTEASRPSERIGLEIANYFTLSDYLTLDLDLAFTDASYSDTSPDGDEIPGAIDSVGSAGLSYRSPDAPWYGSLRYRYFSDRPLIEDNSVRSNDFNSVNLKVGYKTGNWDVSVDLLNLLDSDDKDITYFYESRLPGEPDGGVADRHYHIIEPMTARLNITRLF
ncbi:TonB-dependent receptor [Pelagicoccus albus]|uniref:TonB-dependent receptor n=1 Tax=Pelagicoccus albus TaxID=415222 RepID=A0A7X1E9V7_9BACT|nr:TonB-dependent receptor [Pelagicoccus albus]MBC2607849.1 TonB-dependent receptor [Pelagicoccus albus]